MNIEESIRELKGYLTWLEANGFSKLAKDSAIETILTAYEKEKEKNKSIAYNYEMVVDKLENSTPNAKIKERIKEYYEYDKRMQNKPGWHTTKYYEAKTLEKLLEE